MQRRGPRLESWNLSDDASTVARVGGVLQLRHVRARTRADLVAVRKVQPCVELRHTRAPYDIPVEAFNAVQAAGLPSRNRYFFVFFLIVYSMCVHVCVNRERVGRNDEAIARRRNFFYERNFIKTEPLCDVSSKRCVSQSVSQSVSHSVT